MEDESVEMPAGNEKNSMAIASLVMGILSLVGCCCGGVGTVFGALGITFALLSRGEEPMNTHAKTGLTLSIIGICLGVLVVVLFGVMQLVFNMAEVFGS